MEGPLVVATDQPLLIVSNPSYWSQANDALEKAKLSMKSLGKDIDKVGDRTKRIYYDLLEKANEVGSVFPDLVTPIQRWIASPRE
jgi:hypothetical protein